MTGTLEGRLQVNQGPEKFGVRKSLFYYEPKAPEGALRSDVRLDAMVGLEEVASRFGSALVQLCTRRRRALGTVGFGGIAREPGAVTSFTPKDGFRTRAFLAQPGLWLTLDAGKFARVDYDRNSGEVIVRLDPADQFTPRAFLSVRSAEAGAEYRPATSSTEVRGRYLIPLNAGEVSVTLRPAP